MFTCTHLKLTVSFYIFHHLPKIECYFTRAFLFCQAPRDEHDIETRVFHQKLKLIVDFITNENVFSNLFCIISTLSVEEQKWLLPKSHILLWLDKFGLMISILIISTEFPDKTEDHILFDIKKIHMVY